MRCPWQRWKDSLRSLNFNGKGSQQGKVRAFAKRYTYCWYIMKLERLSTTPHFFPQRDQPAFSWLADGWLWRTEQIHTFKTVLQSVPMGTSAKVICGKVQAALLVENVRKSFDQVSAPLSPQCGACTCTTSGFAVRCAEKEALQVRDKYYRVVKSLVEYLGNKMPPKPHKQAAIHALMLQHWDRVRTAHMIPKLVLALQAYVLQPTPAGCTLASSGP